MTLKKFNKKWQPKKIKTNFNGGALTNYAGLYPIVQFMQKLEVFKNLEKIELPIHHNAKYSNAQILGLSVCGKLAGMNRINKLESFSSDKMIQHLLNFENKIDEDTISSRFKRFTQKLNNQFLNIISQISRQIHKKLNTDKDILDIDSTPKIVYGHQEGSAKGYNHSKKTANCYHPLIAFLNSTKECFSVWLRPGNSYTSNNAASFLKDCFNKLPSSLKSLLIRADSGFFSDEIIRLIEEENDKHYLIKVKMRNLKPLLEKQIGWQPMSGSPDQECCSFYHQCASWETERRFVAIRSLKEELRIEDGDTIDYKIYNYICYVTDLPESEKLIHRLYQKRGESENWIENLKNQVFDGITVDHFWATEAFWICSSLAYNISLWFRKLTDYSIWRQEPATFREWFIKLAGKFVCSGRQYYLKLCKYYHHKHKWRKLLEEINKMGFG